jgi:tRNA threonylcarbamoyladenosine biosynthesis protein TsaE
VAAAEERSFVVAEQRESIQRLTLAELVARGVVIGRRLRAPALVTLMGDLGAGKTTLVQAICRGLGVPESVTSPTFALIHEYAAPSARVVHCDLYRLQTDADIASLGLDDMLGDPDVIMLVEWPERAGAMLAGPTLALMLAHVPDNAGVRLVSEVWSA